MVIRWVASPTWDWKAEHSLRGELAGAFADRTELIRHVVEEVRKEGRTRYMAGERIRVVVEVLDAGPQPQDCFAVETNIIA